MFFAEVLGTARILKAVHRYAGVDESDRNDDEWFTQTRLLFQYVQKTALSRLSLLEWWRGLTRSVWRMLGLGSSGPLRQRLVRVPPASVNLLEKLGVATAFSLIDDELAVEKHAIPQQLLIPSGQGLKLLDLCPVYDDDSDMESMDSTTRRRNDSDSDDSDDSNENFHQTLRRKILRTRNIRRRRAKSVDSRSVASEESTYEVQFEDPAWWKFLPSLKCIGLSCLAVDGTNTNRATRDEREMEHDADDADPKRDMVRVVSTERPSNQLKSLAECIGFSVSPNSFGERGDLTPFTERLRMMVLSNALVAERLLQDSHERSSEHSRWWGLLRPDATSMVLHDSRSGAYQLLSIGDPIVISSFCNDAWQGENSTILPLSNNDRNTILETSRNWKLADLDVEAFSYSPIPKTFFAKLESSTAANNQVYLLDNAVSNVSLAKDRAVSEDWLMVKNQIFLGMLGSQVIPRREIQKLLSCLSEAGVRFVYFSPRNMRRQKELAQQMGIDVAWNCAISLRPLKSGEADPHRMVSNYADWSVNAKLPHGVEDVRTHLREVDNVPLLVSLFTDSTKQTTKEMVEVFQEYHDVVISVGLSHLPRNSRIFGTSDISIGVDVLQETIERLTSASRHSSFFRLTSRAVVPSELEFVCAMCSHTCAFRFRGVSSLSYLPEILGRARAALEGATAGCVFLVTGSLSFSFFVLFSVCSPTALIPYVPTLGAVLYLLFVLPLLGWAMVLSDGTEDCMKQVPPKNDGCFQRRQGWVLYSVTIYKALLPAILTQLIHWIALGDLLLALEPDLVSASCRDSWAGAIRCSAMKGYTGPARTMAGSLALVVFVITQIVCGSLSFRRRFVPLWKESPRNGALTYATWLALGMTALYAALLKVPALSWYFYAVSAVIPLVCLAWCEYWKTVQAKHENRSEKLRRLQFETRLGAWSPK